MPGGSQGGHGNIHSGCPESLVLAFVIVEFLEKREDIAGHASRTSDAPQTIMQPTQLRR